MQINMLAELAAPIVFVALFIVCVCLSIAVAIREEKSTITNEREKDFIDKFAEAKKKQIKATPGAISFKVYVIIMCVAPIALGGALLFFVGNPLAAVLGVAVGAIIPEVILRIKKMQNNKDFDERYGRALKQMTSTLRSGLTVQQAVEDVCQNPFLDKHTKDMFTQINSDIRVGIPISDAFKRAAEFHSTCDTRDMAAAMAMQTEVGGNEAAVVENVSNNINSRIMIRKEISTLFLGTKILVYAMDIAPPIMLVVLLAGGGDLMEFYTRSSLNFLIVIGILALFLIGSIISHNLMNKSKVGSD